MKAGKQRSQGRGEGDGVLERVGATEWRGVTELGYIVKVEPTELPDRVAVGSPRGSHQGLGLNDFLELLPLR